MTSYESNILNHIQLAMSEPVRVCPIIKLLQYTKLKKGKVVPKQTIFNEKNMDTLKCSLYRKFRPMTFGLFAEDITIRMLRRQPWRNELSAVAACFGQTLPKNVSLDAFEKIGAWVETLGWNPDEIQTGEEWTYGAVQGHPDVVCGDTVYDIKTTQQWSKMRVNALLQVLAYLALGRALGRELNKIGIILPLQRKVLTYDLTDWDSTLYLSTLQEMAEKMQIGSGSAEDRMILTGYMTLAIGSHTRKIDGEVHRTLTEWVKPKILRTGNGMGLQAPHPTPVQIFLGGNVAKTFSVSDMDIAKSREIVEETGVQLFVHGPYSANLCDSPDSSPWFIDTFGKMLETTFAMGGKGVVIHCGKDKNDPQNGLDNMRRNLKALAERATVECPILLETSAGQGSETCTDPESFINMVKSVDDPRLAVCVDTCHVFSAGHDPMKFINALEVADIDIRLVHFNDSGVPCGACNDCHAFPGMGHIGTLKMNQIAEWCISREVPGVYE